MCSTIMSNINACVKHALYINLESRADRRAHVEAQLASLKMPNLAAERFNAIKHATSGAIGCTMSHMRCIQLAKERGWDHVLVCEDDVLFTNVPLFLAQLSKFMATVPHWDVVLLAGNNIPPYQIINDACVQVGSCQTTTAYISSCAAPRRKSIMPLTATGLSCSAGTAGS